MPPNVISCVLFDNRHFNVVFCIERSSSTSSNMAYETRNTCERSCLYFLSYVRFFYNILLAFCSCILANHRYMYQATDTTNALRTGIHTIFSYVCIYHLKTIKLSQQTSSKRIERIAFQVKNPPDASMNDGNSKIVTWRALRQIILIWSS